MSREPLRLTIQYPEPLVAGELVTVRFIYEVASAGMAAGGRLRLALPNPGWGQPLVPQHYFWDCYQKGKDRHYTDYDKVNLRKLRKLVETAVKTDPRLLDSDIVTVLLLTALGIKNPQSVIESLEADSQDPSAKVVRGLREIVRTLHDKEDVE